MSPPSLVPLSHSSLHPSTLQALKLASLLSPCPQRPQLWRSLALLTGVSGIFFSCCVRSFPSVARANICAGPSRAGSRQSLLQGLRRGFWFAALTLQRWCFLFVLASGTCGRQKPWIQQSLPSSSLGFHRSTLVRANTIHQCNFVMTNWWSSQNAPVPTCNSLQWKGNSLSNSWQGNVSHLFDIWQILHCYAS